MKLSSPSQGSSGGGGGGGGAGSDTTAYHSTDATLTPSADASQVLGTSTVRLAGVVADTHLVYKSSGDANASAGITDGTLLLGKGGATTIRAFLQQTSTDGIALVPTGSKIQQTDAPTVGADYVNKTYADAAVATEATNRATAVTAEAASRVSGDSATLASAEAYANAHSMVFVQTVLVGVATDTITFTGLSGNADGIYIIKGKIVAGNSDGNFIKLQPNGSDANMKSIWTSNDGTTVTPSTQAFGTINELAASGTASVLFSEFVADCSEGLTRGGMFTSTRGTSTIETGGITYNDVSTNITSLVLLEDSSTTHDGIGVGSHVTLYKLAR